MYDLVGCSYVAEVLKYRHQLYLALGSRSDSVMELLDALSGNQNAKSVAELSLSSLFRRDYNSLYKGIQNFLPPPEPAINGASQDSLLSVVSATVPPPLSRSFYLFGLDVTPYPRPHSRTLEDRKYIYQPNQIQGNKPINIGHSYSVIAALPESSSTGNSSWVIPLLGERVSSQDKDRDVAQKQVLKIFSLPSVPWQDKLSVLVADSVYSQRSFLSAQVQLERLVTITRARSNRVFYRQFISQHDLTHQLGHPRWFGDKFDLKDNTTWGEPHQVVCSTFITQRGRQLYLKISGWKQMLMKGTKDYKMHDCPFTESVSALLAKER